MCVCWLWFFFSCGDDRRHHVHLAFYGENYPIFFRLFILLFYGYFIVFECVFMVMVMFVVLVVVLAKVGAGGSVKRCVCVCLWIRVFLCLFGYFQCCCSFTRAHFIRSNLCRHQFVFVSNQFYKSDFILNGFSFKFTYLISFAFVSRGFRFSFFSFVRFFLGEHSKRWRGETNRKD